MTINDIMMRDLQEEERKQRERAERVAATIGDRCGLPWVRIAIALFVIIAILGAVFMAGAAWQANEIRRQDDAFNRFLLDGIRDATRRVEAMTNAELLRTERECATAN